MYRSVVAMLLMLWVFGGCDRGLTPPSPDSTTAISGTVHFEGKLPQCDSIVVLAVVLSEDPAPFSVANVFANYGKTIVVDQLVACPIRDTSFLITPPSPGIYHYLGVIEKFGRPDSLTLDWQILGFAHTLFDSAQSFTLLAGDHIDTINLVARFDSLPRQPFVK
ncbi:MAG TPA: hypothetical protein VEW28_09125 [Candidatus Kapabacteria bacterium]|nr:hypothetical protein [Candidatus Kapabacteria bacterium]